MGYIIFLAFSQDFNRKPTRPKKRIISAHFITLQVNLQWMDTSKGALVTSHRIGWWENWNRKARFFDGKNRWVSGEDFPNKTNPMVTSGSNPLISPGHGLWFHASLHWDSVTWRHHENCWRQLLTKKKQDDDGEILDQIWNFMLFTLIILMTIYIVSFNHSDILL